ncbi:MAG: protein arginine kinase [Pirellulaceae bacterium]|nr:protein arginine kinase [Pirellulaceae bacterium]
MNFDDLLRNPSSWLQGTGPEADVVISSRIRLARNLADFPFIRQCTHTDRKGIESQIKQQLLDQPFFAESTFIDVSELSKLERQLLVERQLISQELSKTEGARSVAIAKQEAFSLMINEEDHLRIQVMESGFNLKETWDRINELDDHLEERLTYAFHEKFGYLTACPTNVGTGMRVSVMLHLPALTMTDQVDKVFRSLQEINLVVRGLYGEGSQSMGDLFQISNQLTLGKTEEELLAQVKEVVTEIIAFERKAREHLLLERKRELSDRASRAIGILSSAHTITSEETMDLLSSLRMGIYLNLVTQMKIPDINRIFLETQPAHLQKIYGGELDTYDRNTERAQYLQRYLHKISRSSDSSQN